MRLKPKVSISTSGDCECFDVTFRDREHMLCGERLRQHFTDAKFTIKERPPIDQVVVWEVHLQLGETITVELREKIDQMIADSMLESA